MAEKGLTKEFKVPVGSVVVPDRFDSRVVTKNVSLGRITLKELNAHLASLPDDENACTKVSYGTLLDQDDGANEQPDKLSALGPSTRGGSFTS